MRTQSGTNSERERGKVKEYRRTHQDQFANVPRKNSAYFNFEIAKILFYLHTHSKTSIELNRCFVWFSFISNYNCGKKMCRSVQLKLKHRTMCMKTTCMKFDDHIDQVSALANEFALLSTACGHCIPLAMRLHLALTLVGTQVKNAYRMRHFANVANSFCSALFTIDLA